VKFTGGLLISTVHFCLACGGIFQGANLKVCLLQNIRIKFNFFYVQIIITFGLLCLLNVGYRLTVLTPLIWHLTVLLSVRSVQWHHVIVTVGACMLPCNTATCSTASCKVQNPTIFVRFEFWQTWAQGFVILHLLCCISIVFTFLESGMS
jgi:hypothetical protein